MPAADFEVEDVADAEELEPVDEADPDAVDAVPFIVAGDVDMTGVEVDARKPFPMEDVVVQEEVGAAVPADGVGLWPWYQVEAPLL